MTDEETYAPPFMLAFEEGSIRLIAGGGHTIAVARFTQDRADALHVALTKGGPIDLVLGERPIYLDLSPFVPTPLKELT